MPAPIEYKDKYLELRHKYMADLDMAFRLGFEAGAQQAQQQQAVDAQAQQAQMGGNPGMPIEGGAEQDGSGQHVGGTPGKPTENAAQEGQPMNGSSGNGSEIDQHINKLQGMMGKGHSPEIQKTISDIINLRKAEKEGLEFQKSQSAITGIVKALHKPAFKMSIQANHNMDDSAKKALTLQHKIVNDVMEKWEKEEEAASKDIKNILNIEGLLGE
jgi:hypothetical protein